MFPSVKEGTNELFYVYRTDNIRMCTTLRAFSCEINFTYRRYEFSENRDYFLCDIYIVQ